MSLMMPLSHMPVQPSSWTAARPAILRRRCACGGTPGPDGECAACRAKRLARRAQPAAIESALGDVAPPEPRPLDSSASAEATPGYGHDFGRLRVHADPRAAAGGASVIQPALLAVGPRLQRQPASSGGAVTDPLAYAQNLETNYPGWRAALPDCPCTDAEARDHPEMWAGGIGGCPDFFHPGAATGYRSKGRHASVPGTSHGQQCCYDTQGRLITDGPGAGTPDVWSPETDVWNHQLYDVQTWFRLGWSTYNRYWIPNRGSNCPPNRVERPTARCEPRYLGFGDRLGEDCIVRPGPGPKF